ncbi:hypothetical protein, partial [Serratia sp. Nf2]|uniref:hypothetical protein n=1 Tax=Serratia sp. Nf2 TaxID=2116540 RepID=UPI001E410949
GPIRQAAHHTLNHWPHPTLVRADTLSPDLIRYSRTNTKTKKPATEVVGFFAIIAGSIWFTGDVFGGAGGI